MFIIPSINICNSNQQNPRYVKNFFLIYARIVIYLCTTFIIYTIYYKVHIFKLCYMRLCRYMYNTRNTVLAAGHSTSLKNHMNRQVCMHVTYVQQNIMPRKSNASAATSCLYTKPTNTFPFSHT